MAETKIEWAHYTFNPWIGCTKVSAGCANCYAETQDNHRKWTPEGWGKGKPRKRTSESYWREPLKWNRKAEGALQCDHCNEIIHGGACPGTGCPINAGECCPICYDCASKLRPYRPRVFCASLADVFDPEAPPVWRLDLLDMIQQTPHLDWLILTKRPENLLVMLTACMVMAEERGSIDLAAWLWDWLDGKPPRNVWLGTSVENQRAADERIPHLLKIPAVVRFLSCEPLLEKLRIYNYIKPWKERSSTMYGVGYERMNAQLHWIIGGGESGHNARPCHPDAARSLRDECRVAGVPFLWKQWGEWVPACSIDSVVEDKCYRPAPKHDPERTRECLVESVVMHDDGSLHELRTGAFQQGASPMQMFKVGKKKAGRLLDGRTWDEYPTP